MENLLDGSPGTLGFRQESVVSLRTPGALGVNDRGDPKIARASVDDQVFEYSNSPVPLTPTGGGVCISVAALRPADIVVSTHGGFKQFVIRHETDSDVGHALVYIGDGEIIEAVPPVARKVPLEDSIGECRLAVAYRRIDMHGGEVKVVLNYLKQQVDKKIPYDTIGAGTGGARANLPLCLLVLGPPLCVLTRANAFDNPDRAYCSKLVLKAFEMAGRPLTNVPAGVSNPNNIVEAYSQGLVEYVGHLKP